MVYYYFGSAISKFTTDWIYILYLFDITVSFIYIQSSFK